MKATYLSLLLLSLILIGCGRSTSKPSFDQAAPGPSGNPRLNSPGPAPTEFVTAQIGRPEGVKDAPVGNDLPPERKIVFNGTLDVEVKEFGEARTRLDELVRNAKAYYSKSDVTGDSGKKRHGTFVVKVPVENFQSLVNDITHLGNPLKNHTDSQDVTEEFVDTAARVKNLKAEEEVLNKLLKEAGSRLEDVFKIREHIRTNRLEIERNEARVLALGKLASLSTLTVTLREIEAYVAPVVPVATPPAAPEFAERAGKTWGESFAALTTLGQTVAIVFIALAPWTPLILAMGLGLWAARRYYVRHPATA